uniref:Uncharacterized protein n=1 Tax=Romanomermis culicivorax TaxID=13658 RepID=A0A915IJL4_ROMCU
MALPSLATLLSPSSSESPPGVLDLMLSILETASVSKALLAMRQKCPKNGLKNCNSCLKTDVLFVDAKLKLIEQEKEVSHLSQSNGLFAYK